VPTRPSILHLGLAAWATAFLAIEPARSDTYYRIGYGANDELCVAQFNLLAARARAEGIPVCDIGVHLPPNVQKAEWEEVDIARNLKLMQRIEWALRFEISPRPHEELDVWFEQLQRRMKNPRTRPHLRRLTLSLRNDGHADFIYGYVSGQVDCDASKGLRTDYFPGMRFLMDDEQKGIAHPLDILPGRLAFYKRQPYIFSSGMTDRTHFWEWVMSIHKIQALPEPRKSTPHRYDPPFIRNYKAEHVCYIAASPNPPPGR
jgi:hypothetical protein